MSPRGAVNFQNSDHSAPAGVAAARSPGEFSTLVMRRTSQTSVTPKASRIGTAHPSATPNAPPPAITTAPTPASWSTARPIRSTSAFGSIVPKPRVAATETVYAADTGRNAASTRM